MPNVAMGILMMSYTESRFVKIVSLFRLGV